MFMKTEDVIKTKRDFVEQASLVRAYPQEQEIVPTRTWMPA